MLFKIVTRLIVNLSGRGFGFDFSDGAILRFTHNFANIVNRTGYFTQKDHTCQVAFVAVNINSHIKQDNFVIFYLTVAYLRMGQAGIGSRGYDWVKGKSGAMVFDTLLQAPFDLLLSK